MSTTITTTTTTTKTHSKRDIPTAPPTNGNNTAGFFSSWSKAAPSVSQSKASIPANSVSNNKNSEKENANVIGNDNKKDAKSVTAGVGKANANTLATTATASPAAEDKKTVKDKVKEKEYPLEPQRLTPSGKPIGPRLRKVCILGSRAVGKSTLTTLFTDAHFLERYYPTIESTQVKEEMIVKGRRFRLEVMDQGGVDEYTILSSRCTVGFQGWIFCYSIDSRQSFEIAKIIRDKVCNLTTRDDIPCILVGNKKDLDKRRQVSTSEASAVAQSWGPNTAFFETSAKVNQDGEVERVFEKIVEEVEKDLNGAWGTGGVSNGDADGEGDGGKGGCIIS